MKTFTTNCIIQILLASVMLFPLITYAQPNSINKTTTMYTEHAAAIYPELVAIRRSIFNHPEASGQEKRTARLVADYLKKLGLDVTENVGGYGVVGVLKGRKPGKRIAWRADMDAATFRMGDHNHAHQDLSHICGHDVNTTIALGMANTLTQNIDQLSGTVYFIFQPAEETQKGAKAMIDDGLLEQMQADEIYASHVGPSPTGVISTKQGNLFSHSRYLELQFNGSDDAEILVDSIQSMMNSETRIKSPDQFIDLSSTMNLTYGMASPETIYQNYILFGGRPQSTQENNQVTLHAELFTAEHDDIVNVVNSLKESILKSEFKDRFVSIKVHHEREGVDNNMALVKQARQFLTDSFGESVTQRYYGQVPFASEDFGHFQKSIPGVYFFIGASNAEKDIVAFPHMPNFDVDEKVIEHGVARFSSLLNQRLSAK